MFDTFDLIFSKVPTSAEELKSKRVIPPELAQQATSEVKRIVLDPEKSADIVRKAIVLEVRSSATPTQEQTARMKPGSGGVMVGPEWGIEPCVYVTIGFFTPCGELRIGGCS